jgi:PTH1 family peptidyl-tRNA hydrolase
MAEIQLIVGLGNPGPKYEKTRHNVGFWFVQQLAASKGTPFRHEAKFQGETCRLTLHGQDIILLKPLTYMNHSGQAVGAVARFYKIQPENILVVHDELDINPGEIRLKAGGGHGGHNGLRDTVAHLGSKEFTRLRLGIGHPGNSRDVSDYVLSKPSSDDAQQIEQACDDAYREMANILKGDLQKAMNHLHSGR